VRRAAGNLCGKLPCSARIPEGRMGRGIFDAVKCPTAALAKKTNRCCFEKHRALPLCRGIVLQPARGGTAGTSDTSNAISCPKKSRTQRLGRGIGPGALPPGPQHRAAAGGLCRAVRDGDGQWAQTPHRPCSEAPAERAARPSAGRDIPRVTAPRGSRPPLCCRYLTCRAAGHRGAITAINWQY